MPLPIWTYAADCMMNLIKRDMTITEDQEHTLRDYFRALPVRSVLELLRVVKCLNFTISSIVFSESQEFMYLIEAHTVYQDHCVMIINAVRTGLNLGGWFPTDSEMSERTHVFMEDMRSIEDTVGFDVDTLMSFVNAFTRFTLTIPSRQDGQIDVRPQTELVNGDVVVEATASVTSSVSYQSDDTESTIVADESSESTVDQEGGVSFFVPLGT